MNNMPSAKDHHYQVLVKCPYAGPELLVLQNTMVNWCLANGLEFCNGYFMKLTYNTIDQHIIYYFKDKALATQFKMLFGTSAID